jgi:hypothetical protein
MTSPYTLLAAAVVIAATREKRIRLTGRPQMLPFFRAFVSGVKRAKSPAGHRREADRRLPSRRPPSSHRAP